MDLQWRPLP